MVGVSPKFDITQESEKAVVQYPTQSLKHNRNYQVGIVLSDRYGRQSDVILSNIEDQTVVENVGNQRITFGGSTIYVPYKPNVLEPNTTQGNIVNTKVPDAGILSWPGDSIKLRWTNGIPPEITTNPGYPGLYEDVKGTLEFTNIVGSNWTLPQVEAELAEPGLSLIHI